jgi:hypothetical protein
VIGLAWYRPEQWQRLRQVSVDVEDLEETYFEWVSVASACFQEVQELGVDIRRVDVDVEDLVEWCKRRGLPLDAEARVSYVTDRIEHLRRRHPSRA